VQRKEHELREEVDATQRRNTETVEPELRRLEESIVEAREDLARADASVEAQRKTKAELNARVAALKSEKQKIAEELAATRIELGKVKADPDRLTYVPRPLSCPLSVVYPVFLARWSLRSRDSRLGSQLHCASWRLRPSHAEGKCCT
jgi:hypothetical protein